MHALENLKLKDFTCIPVQCINEHSHTQFICLTKTNFARNVTFQYILYKYLFICREGTICIHILLVVHYQVIQLQNCITEQSGLWH